MMQPGQQGQQGQQQLPPAQIAPEQLMAILSALHGMGGQQGPQPVPMDGQQAAQGSGNNLLGQLVQLFTANPQQMQAQQQAQQPQPNPGMQLMQLLGQMGLRLG